MISTKLCTKLPMLISRQLLVTNALKITNSRFIFNNSIKLQQEQATKPSTGANTVHPTNFQKKILVWMGKYKTADQIPERVQHEVMDRANNQFRIRLSNIMMALTALGCILMVISGKKAAERGESVTKMNLDWHQKYKEDSEKKAASAVAK